MPIATYRKSIGQQISIQHNSIILTLITIEYSSTRRRTSQGTCRIKGSCACSISRIDTSVIKCRWACSICVVTTPSIEGYAVLSGDWDVVTCTIVEYDGVDGDGSERIHCLFVYISSIFNRIHII